MFNSLERLPQSISFPLICKEFSICRIFRNRALINSNSVGDMEESNILGSLRIIPRNNMLANERISVWSSEINSSSPSTT